MEVKRFRSQAALLLFTVAAGSRAIAAEPSAIETLIAKDCRDRPPGIELVRAVDEIRQPLILSGPEDKTKLSINSDGQGGLIFDTSTSIRPVPKQSEVSAAASAFIADANQSGVLFEDNNRITVVRVRGKLADIISNCK